MKGKMMAWKSVLKPPESVMASVATVGAVYGVYQLSVGNVASAQASDANHPVLASARKKAGLSAFVLVGSLFMLTKDANVFVLGCGTIIAMEFSYRHAIMAHPQTQKIQAPDGNLDYIPASDDAAPSVVPDDMSSYEDALAY